MEPDNRIVVPAPLRRIGILGGLVAMALGLIIAWRRSGADVVLPPTGWRKK